MLPVRNSKPVHRHAPHENVAHHYRELISDLLACSEVAQGKHIKRIVCALLSTMVKQRKSFHLQHGYTHFEGSLGENIC